MCQHGRSNSTDAESQMERGTISRFRLQGRGAKWTSFSKQLNNTETTAGMGFKENDSESFPFPP